MVEICMFGSVVFEVIALNMFHVYENKVTVNGCKFCTLRRMLILNLIRRHAESFIMM